MKSHPKHIKGKLLSTCDYVCCLILAPVLAASSYYIANENYNFTFGFILTSVVTFIILISLAYAARWFFQASTRADSKKHKLLNLLDKLFCCKHSVLAVSGIILLFWLLPLIFLYPGTCTNDTWGQLHEYMTFMNDPIGNSDGTVSDHHPIFDTFLIGTAIVPLSKLTGLWQPIIFLYVIVQAVITSLSFSCVVNYAYKKLELGALPTALILGMFCCIQIYPATVQIVSKDTLHSWVFVFYVLLFTELVRTKGSVAKNWKFMAMFLLVVILCCLTKKVGFYVVLISLLFYVIFCRKNWLPMLIPLVCSVVLTVFIMPTVLKAMNVEQGEMREMFSLPFQMSAKYVSDHPSDITHEEYAVLDKTLNMDTLAERYDASFADPVKNGCLISELPEFLDYTNVWLMQGVRHPDSYALATGSMLAGWFSWQQYAPEMSCGWKDQFNPNEIPSYVPERQGLNLEIANSYRRMVYSLYEVPPLRLFHTSAFWSTLIIAFSLCTAIKFRRAHKKGWLVCVPCLCALVLGCYLAPTTSLTTDGARYLIPLIYASPLLIAWCFHVSCQKEKHLSSSS